MAVYTTQVKTVCEFYAGQRDLAYYLKGRNFLYAWDGSHYIPLNKRYGGSVSGTEEMTNHDFMYTLEDWDDEYPALFEWNESANRWSPTRYGCGGEILTANNGSDTIEQMIQAAAPLIFPNYPIYSESHRAELNAKILRHYYFKEIGLETVGMWKAFLARKMYEIMPYYNELYRSEEKLLSTDMLRDVDRFTASTGSRSAASAKSTTKNDKSTRESSNTGSENFQQSSEDSREKAGAENVGEVSSNASTQKTSASFDESGNDSRVKTDSDKVDSTKEDTAKSEGDLQRAQSGSANVKEESDGSSHTARSENVAKTNASSETGGDREATSSNSYASNADSANTASVSSDSSHEHAATEDNSQSSTWSLFSDTPQGGINALTGDITKGPTGEGGDTNNYLTNATHNFGTTDRVTDTDTDRSSAQYQNSDSSSAAQSTTESSNAKDSTYERSSAAHDASETSAAEIASASNAKETSELSSNATSEQSSNSQEAKSTTTQQRDTTSDVKGDYEKSGSREGTLEEAASQTRDSQKATSATEKGLGSVQHSKTTEGSGNVSVSGEGSSEEQGSSAEENTGNVHEYGKSPGRTYARMITEYREAIINIDLLIVDALSDLFMQVY